MFETTTATVVPTEVSHITIITTVLNSVTTTIPVLASATIDYTVTLVESKTTTETVLETTTVVQTPLVPSVYKRVNGYDIPDYALACTDIYQYSSACGCIGFVPKTSTAPAPKTTIGATVTVTGSTDIVFSTIEAEPVTQIVTTIPVTVTASTISVSKAVETVTSTTVIATDTTTVTETSFTTLVPTPTEPVPAPTVTINLTAGDNLFAENINVSPGAQVGVLASIRETTNKATLVFNGGDGTLDLVLPAATVKYSVYYYGANAAFSYVQFTTARIANIIGVTKVVFSLSSSNELTSSYAGVQSEFWLCGRNFALVKAGFSQPFINACTTGARRITLTGILV